MKKIMKELILKLSDLESIKVIPNDNIDFSEMHMCCYEVKVYLVSEFELRIGQETVGEVCELFINRFKKAINNNLKLHESLIEDLGLMYNEYSQISFHDKSKFFMIASSNSKINYWVGSQYEIWSTYADANPYVTTWLYNDDQGNIIFEVTPFYRWSMQEVELKDPEFITYEEFMKDYKPLIKRVIPREIAIEWFEQIMKVYRGFFSTEENYLNALKRLDW